MAKRNLFLTQYSVKPLQLIAASFKDKKALRGPLARYWNIVLSLAETKDEKLLLNDFKDKPIQRKIIVVNRWLVKKLNTREGVSQKLDLLTEAIADSHREVFERSELMKSKVVDKQIFSAAYSKQMIKNIINDLTGKGKQPKVNTSPQTACFIRASVDKSISLKQGAVVHVEISLEKLAALHNEKEGRTASGRINPIQELTVRIIPTLNCSIEGNDTSRIAPPKKKDPRSVQFHIKADYYGDCKITIDVEQGQYTVCNIELSFTAPKILFKTPGKAKQVAQIPEIDLFESPINKITICEIEKKGVSYFMYFLDFRKLDIDRRFNSDPIKGSTNFLKDLNKRIEALQRQEPVDTKTIRKELREFGAKYFDSLFPLEMRQLLYKHRNKIGSFQISTNDSVIPWEMIVITNPAKAGIGPSDRSFGELGVLRWLPNFQSPVLVHVYKDKTRYIQPRYATTGLPALNKEILFLKDTFNAAPVIPESVPILKALSSKKKLNLVHFCCHGKSDPQSIAHAYLDLGSGQQFSQNSVDTMGLIFNNRTERPMIVLNCCQTGRSGSNLNGFGGFAQAFLKAGAGIFVGTLWSIEDQTALSFVCAFYESLIAGETVSEAVLKGRKAAYGSGDATWLAYTVYAHPFAKIALKEAV